MQTRSEVSGAAFVLMVGSGIVLGVTQAVDPFLVVCIPVLIAAAALFATPYTFWLRADERGLTLVKRLLPRRYAWTDVHGLAMEFGQDAEGDGRHLTLRLRLTEPKGRFWGPLIGRFQVTEEDTHAGVPPRAMAELFAVFGEHQLPVEKPEFANEVLRVRGLPPLPPWASWVVPAEGPSAPELAYADAPDLATEEREVEALAARAKARMPLRREYLLRCAALADRRCLRDGGERGRFGAVAAAEELVETDQIRVDGDPRPYVRRQYLIWRRASGR